MIKVISNVTFRIEEDTNCILALTPGGWHHVSAVDHDADNDIDSQLEEAATDFIQMCEFVTKMTNNEM